MRGLCFQRLFKRNKFFQDFKDTFDVLTIALPAGLPAAMSIGKCLLTFSKTFVGFNSFPLILKGICTAGANTAVGSVAIR